jgi:hypothetical protein
MTGKTVVPPIADFGSGRYRCTMLDQRHEVESADELATKKR